MTFSFLWLLSIEKAPKVKKKKKKKKKKKTVTCAGYIHY